MIAGAGLSVNQGNAAAQNELDTRFTAIDDDRHQRDFAALKKDLQSKWTV